METITHTPGPWYHHMDDYVEALDLDVPLSVCTLAEGEHKEANARLIAAAPDLLRVLMQLVDDPRDESPGIWSDAYEAVMRATGRPDTRIGGSGGAA